ncbi:MULTISPECIES: tetratricopeptide repeat protein [unclassified Iodidimonas]|uniref:tetratricopeptide repeat protein n=1 Tax=unclassified Iodidimonas TaxID=2626145 RepID=UPI0024824F7E|nr:MULTISPECIES: tetratricopeptide repeat protein [unclassified Iodidimonas]
MRTTKISGPLARSVILGLSMASLAACATVSDAPDYHASRNAALIKPATADHYAMKDILLGDFDQAEQRLRNAEAYDENDPYRLINLALVLQKTGRMEEAAALYRRVLELEQNPRAGLASGYGQSVKDIAGKALASIDRESNEPK